ncbi:MAG TPA: SpoIID/LytB domain-containing protein [Candidatus Obscuribacterales bacterium]
MMVKPHDTVDSCMQQRGWGFWSVFATGGWALLVWVLWVCPALALELRVAIREGASEVVVGTSSAGVLRNQQGQTIAAVPEGRSLAVTPQGSQIKAANAVGSSFWVEPGPEGFVFIGDRWYRGRVLVMASGNGVTAINYVDLDQYLYSVVGGEMPTSWPLEALKAQAVAARSYVLYKRQQARNPQYDVGPTTTWQVYKGLEAEAPSTQAAVNATRHQVLTYNGQVIEAVFHSSSGGHTENVEDVWSQPLPYLRGVQDYDAGAPVYQWTQSFSVDQLSSLLPEVGRIISVTPQSTTPRGRVRQVRVEGDRGSQVMTGNDLRNALSLRSTLFSIAIAGNTVQVTGRGYGHGIGMSQWGAHNMASQGYTYQQILGHYYQGAQLATIQVR